MTEGTWTSSGFRPTATAAKVAQVLLGLNAVVSVLAVVVSYLGHGIVDRSVFAASDRELLDWAAGFDSLAIAQIVLLIVTAVAYLVWFHRTVGNVPWLGGGTPRWSPGWSVGWWFVPIAFLVMPYLVVREVYQRLTWTRSGSTAIVALWWVAWIGSEVAARIADRSFSETIAGIHTSLNWWVAADSISAVAAVLALIVVRHIEANAERRARHAALMVTPQPLPV